MTLEELVSALREIAPSRLRDLLAAVNLVEDELKYAKSTVDTALQEAIGGNQYEKVRELLTVSEALHQNAVKIATFLEENDADGDSDEEEPIGADSDDAERVDYNAYRADETVPHDLFSSVTYKKPSAFRYKGRKYHVETWSGMLLRICELLYAENKELFISFASDPTMQGKKKPRFAATKSALRNGVPVKGGLFVETNLSANDIRKTILSMLEKYGIASDAVQIYFAKDLTPLHQKNSAV